LHWRAPQKISTRDSPPVIGPFYAYFAVFRRPCRMCKYLIVLLIGVLITRRSAVRSCSLSPNQRSGFPFRIRLMQSVC
jgi:hypothetical protein